MKHGHNLDFLSDQITLTAVQDTVFHLEHESIANPEHFCNLPLHKRNIFSFSLSTFRLAWLNWIYLHLVALWRLSKEQLDLRSVGLWVLNIVSVRQLQLLCCLIKVMFLYFVLFLMLNLFHSMDQKVDLWNIEITRNHSPNTNSFTPKPLFLSLELWLVFQLNLFSNSTRKMKLSK